MAIPIILKGETAKQITLVLAEGYDYAGCELDAVFCGKAKRFADLVAGGTIELNYAACETMFFPLGTSKLYLSIRNGAGEVKFLPWEKIKVTDSPTEVHEAEIRIDPATLDVTDATSKDSLAAVKSKLNAVLAFLRRTSAAWMVAALPLAGICEVVPLYTTQDELPGDAQVMTNVAPYVDAKTDAALGEFSRTNKILKAGPYLSSTGGVVNTRGGITLHYNGPTLGAWPQNSWITPYGFGMFGGFLQEGIEFQNRNVYVSKTGRHVTMRFPLDDSWEDGADVGDLALRSDITDTDLTPSTNYTDRALGAFAATGTITRALSYGTPNRWVDATGCVWSVAEAFPATVQVQGYGSYDYSGISGNTHRWGTGEEVYVSYEPREGSWTYYNSGAGVWIGTSLIAEGSISLVLDNAFGGGALSISYSGYGWATNFVGCVAMTNDIPNVSGYATPADVTAAIREQSLGGVYDSELGVWWTPHMANGAYYWTATTNVNLNAGGN